jgi:hypothetical protein
MGPETNGNSTTMKKRLLFLALSCIATMLSMAENDKPPALNPHLECLRPLLGKTWKGVFEGSKPDKPTTDVARWERALNGQAVRQTHSINNGVYGGETLFIWNEKAHTLEYYYFTTEGYMTTGTFEATDGKFITREQVKGDAGGVTEVRATSEIRPDGKFHVKAEYLKNGQWLPGHEVTYQEDSSSQVVFK